MLNKRLNPAPTLIIIIKKKKKKISKTETCKPTATKQFQSKKHNSSDIRIIVTSK